MKNIVSAIVAASFVLAIIGCGIADRISSDEAVNTAVGESKIGVPECDEVMDALNAELNSPDDNMFTKAIKATVLNRIKDSIRESVEKNKQDTVELAKNCKEFKVQLDKYKAEEAANKNQK